MTLNRSYKCFKLYKDSLTLPNNRRHKLVNKLCKSRNRLMRAYPSTVKEIRFFTTIQRGFRFPPFFVFLGSILYWIMGRFVTRAPRYVSARAIERAEPVINTSEADAPCVHIGNRHRFDMSQLLVV